MKDKGKYNLAVLCPALGLKHDQDKQGEYLLPRK